MKIARRIVLVALIDVPFVLAGCGGGGSRSSPSNRPMITRSQFGPLEFTLSAPKTAYKRGETALLTFTVKNTSANPVYYEANGTSFDSIVMQNGKFILSAGGRGGSLYPVTVAPGETLTYSTGWGQFSDTGDKVPSGTYQFFAFLNSKQFTEAGSEPSILSDQQSQQVLFGPPPIELTIK